MSIKFLFILTVIVMFGSLSFGWKKKLLMFAFFGDFMLFYSFYNSIFTFAKIDAVGISIMFIGMQIGMITADVVSGVMADIFGRRGVFIISQILRILMLSMWLSFQNVVSFFIGMLLFGLSSGCIFGNIESYIYDLMNEKKNFNKFLGLLYGVQNLAIAISSFIGGKVISKEGGWRYMLYFSLICSCISFLFSLTLPVYKKVDIGEFKSCLDEFRISKAHKSVKWYVLFNVLNETLFLFFVNLNTIAMIEHKISSIKIGILCGFMGVIKIFANLIAGYVSDRITGTIICVSMIINLLVIGVLGYAGDIKLLYGIGIFLILLSFSDIAIKSHLHHLLPSQIRTTIASGSGVLMILFVPMLTFIFGFVKSRFGSNFAHLTVAILCASFVFSMMIVRFCQKRSCDQ